MTQKFTAEEVRKEADFLSTYSRKTSRMLAAYADTLSKPADSGRVDDLAMHLACEHGETDEAGTGYMFSLEQFDDFIGAFTAALAAQPKPAYSGRVGDDPIGHPRSETDTRDEIELFLRDAFAAGCHAAQTRSMVFAITYAHREAPKLRAALAAQGQGDAFGWVIPDGEGGYSFRKTPPSDFDREWADKYNRHYTPVFDAPPASPAGVPDGDR